MQNFPRSYNRFNVRTCGDFQLAQLPTFAQIIPNFIIPNFFATLDQCCKSWGMILRPGRAGPFRSEIFSGRAGPFWSEIFPGRAGPGRFGLKFSLAGPGRFGLKFSQAGRAVLVWNFLRPDRTVLV